MSDPCEILSAAAHVDRGCARLRAGQVDAALSDATRALAQDGRMAAAHRLQGAVMIALGRLDAAEAACHTALDLMPNYPAALASLALVYALSGRGEQAEALLRRIVALTPDEADPLGNLAALLARSGQAAAALVLAVRASVLDPWLPSARFLTGNLRQQAGDPEGAVQAYAAAVAAHPHHADAHRALVIGLWSLGRPAGDAARKALVVSPSDAAVWSVQGAIRQDAGDGPGARVAFERVWAVMPGDPELGERLAGLRLACGDAAGAAALLRPLVAAAPARSGLVDPLLTALLRCGAVEEAERVFAASLAAAPAASPVPRAAAVFRFGVLVREAGHRDRAMRYFLAAVADDPSQAPYWSHLSNALQGVRFFESSPALTGIMEAALDHPATEKREMVTAIASLLFLDPAIAAVMGALEREGTAGAAALLRGGGWVGVAGNRLLTGVLRATPMTDPAVERLVTGLRAVLVGQAVRVGGPDIGQEPYLTLCAAVAEQCVLNEYVFDESEEERAAADTLWAAVERQLQAAMAPPPVWMALLAAYRPLHRLAGAAVAAGLPWPEPVARLIRHAIAEPLAEAGIVASIPCLTPIDDPVSAAVRGQYEENPYPRWRHARQSGEPVTVDRYLAAELPHARLPADLLSPARWERPDILVAGCGTGRDSLWVARQFAGARILAVDLSRASLAYARRQADAAGLGDRLRYAQADLLELGGAGLRFDVIRSLGVLHHLDDPRAGLAVLAGLLRPHGVMELALYSARARRWKPALDAHVAALGTITPDPAGIRALRRSLRGLPADHPLHPLAGSPDFYNLSACRDLMLHMREHHLSLPQLADWLDGLGLVFMGFVFENPRTPATYRARFPDDPAMTDLVCWDRYEQEFPNSFGRMYRFWVRRRREGEG